MNSNPSPVRHVGRKGSRVSQPISFCPRSYDALSKIKEGLREATGFTFSNAVVCRALVLEFVCYVLHNHDALESLARKAEACASKGKESNR